MNDQHISLQLVRVKCMDNAGLQRSYMRTNPSHQSVAAVMFGVSTLLILCAVGGFPLTETARGLTEPVVACPPPTQPQGGQCLLRADATLTKTLRLTSDTKLNCQGHKLVPRSLGSGLSQRSVPEVAIFLNGVKNVQIQNCVIDGFDFGIFAVKSKVPAEIRNTPGKLPQLRNKILQNTVNARFLAISLASVDNTEVKDNTIKYTTMGGKGIYVGRDSDLNRIINNTVVGDIAPTPATPAVGAPGPVSKSSNPEVPEGQAILITQTLGPDPTLLNAIIEDELFQLPVVKSTKLNADFSEENLVEGNTISFTQVPRDGIATAVTLKTTVSGNKVSNNRIAIRAGIQSGRENEGLPKKFPGGCSAPATGRLCLDNADCKILGTNGSTCINPAPSTVGVFWVSDGFLVDGNTIIGPFQTAVATTAKNTVVRGNTITGQLRPASPGVAILLAGGFAVGTPTIGTPTIVTRNVVSMVDVSLSLSNNQFPGLEAQTFGARVSLNDFTGYTTSVRSDIAATLSVNGQGNFWGIPCPLGFDPATVQMVNAPTGAVVTDAHPFRIAIARVSASSLPQPCR